MRITEQMKERLRHWPEEDEIMKRLASTAEEVEDEFTEVGSRIWHYGDHKHSGRGRQSED